MPTLPIEILPHPLTAVTITCPIYSFVSCLKAFTHDLLVFHDSNDSNVQIFDPRGRTGDLRWFFLAELRPPPDHSMASSTDTGEGPVTRSEVLFSVFIFHVMIERKKGKRRKLTLYAPLVVSSSALGRAVGEGEGRRLN